MDVLLPDVRVQSASPRLIDSAARFTSPLVGTTRTVNRPGDRWGMQLVYNALAKQDKARMEAFIALQRGAANRILFTPVDYVQRGSFQCPELFPNNKFSQGTTGWSGSGTLTVSDQSMRMGIPYFNGVNQFSLLAPSPATIPVTQYAPYVFRAHVLPGPGSATYRLVVDHGDGSGDYGVGSTYSDYGLKSLAAVPFSATMEGYVQLETVVNGLPGDYLESQFVSLSRCILVDNAPNLLQQSNAFGTSPWALTNATSVADGGIAPDGSTNAKNLHENTTNGTHLTTQSVTVASSAADFSLSCCLQANTQNWAFLQLNETLGPTSVSPYFNLSTGAVGTTSTGANWSGLRTFVQNLGNSWFRFTIVARKTNAATGLSAFIGAANANNGATYAGAGTAAAIAMWEAVLARSSHPTRTSPTTSSTSAGAPQTGSGLCVKALLVSTNGLLLAGDWCEINGELKKVTAALNSDAAGLGYLQFSPPIRISPADSDPLIVNKPMGRFIMKNTENGWNSTPGIFSDYALDLVEAIG